MADKPILFSGPMIRALLDGRKTQTRRALKPQPPRFSPEHERRWSAHAIPHSSGKPSEWGWWEGPWHGPSLYHTQVVPYAPGDRLWVREAFSKHLRLSDPYYLPPGYPDAAMGAHYWADGNPEWGDWERPRPSIHMPRWASRLTLLVTDVRVQRLQEISEDDARAEGIRVLPLQDPSDQSAWWEVEPGEHQARTPAGSFRLLWNSINGPDAWDANPWVVAVSFDVHRCNIDQMEVQQCA